MVPWYDLQASESELHGLGFIFRYHRQGRARNARPWSLDALAHSAYASRFCIAARFVDPGFESSSDQGIRLATHGGGVAEFTG